ncbi:hypothetical protein [Rhodovulum euryhalinum]|uniref:Uncharacterized protein n=1 Tax=Rhodovulum euryhalinum TaxID=35805 RepID=A0A4R2KIH0_9RHOB|nr:hypothetical protein [Rhodovulum euryhalinum]TCO70326.1 hypothetical protein EV655_11091 [Rhodovulum euryhalinum]
MAGNHDSRFIQSVAPFNYVMTDYDWDLSRNGATPFSSFFGMPMVSRRNSKTQLNTDWPTPLSSFFYIPMVSRRESKVRLVTGRRILSLGG